MKTLPFALLFAGLLVANAASGQTTTRLRGTITEIEGNVLLVKSRDGKDVKVQVPDNVSVAVATAIRFDDIKQGDYVGATTMAAADGTLTASEVHYLPPTVPEGHGPWDLQPGSMMTNANVSSVVAAADHHELTLQYKIVSFEQDRASLDKSQPLRASLAPHGGEKLFFRGAEIHVSGFARRFARRRIHFRRRASRTRRNGVGTADSSQQGRRPAAAVVAAGGSAEPFQ